MDRAAYHREYYKKNKAKSIAAHEATKQKKRAFIDSLKDSCVRCGEDDKRCLDFHHIDPMLKEFTISAGWKYAKSNARIIAETNKCVVLCANCHRKEHNGNSTGL